MGRDRRWEIRDSDRQAPVKFGVRRMNRLFPKGWFERVRRLSRMCTQRPREEQTWFDFSSRHSTNPVPNLCDDFKRAQTRSMLVEILRSETGRRVWIRSVGSSRTRGCRTRAGSHRAGSASTTRMRAASGSGVIRSRDTATTDFTVTVHRTDRKAKDGP